MARYGEQEFIDCLKKCAEERTQENLQIIYSYLHGLEALSSLREVSLRALCKTVRYERHDANDILYCRLPSFNSRTTTAIPRKASPNNDLENSNGPIITLNSEFQRGIGDAHAGNACCEQCDQPEDPLHLPKENSGNTRTRLFADQVSEACRDPSKSAPCTQLKFPDQTLIKWGGKHVANGGEIENNSFNYTQRRMKQMADGIGRGELSTCWFILLSGSVFIEGSMYLPRSSFGKRSGGSGRRVNECLILEPSEMIVIDYPDVQLMRPGQRQSCTTMNLEKLLALEQEEVSIAAETRRRMHLDNYEDKHLCHLPLSLDYQPVQTMLHRSETLLKSNRSSHSSDSSSAYSGSDTMQSAQSSLDEQEVDLSGLIEGVVDSDEEDESVDSLPIRDTVRECLDKDPCDRTEDDIEVLLEFMQHLPAFANMTLAVRRALCAVMVFAVVDKAGTIVMNHEEELDSWSVIVNGHVEIEFPDGQLQELHLGDSFGITPTMEKMYHQGVMRTKVDDCQFVCIAQSDYYSILHQGEENTRKHEEDGEVVLVTEHRVVDGGSRRGHVVIRGTVDRLMAQLVEDNVMDPSYVEDFLLTQRIFIFPSTVISNNLLLWFNDPILRDKVTRVVLLWVNNHFTDFEMDPEMMEFLEKFESSLEKEKMQGQLRLLNIACATNARNRTITLARSTRDEVLHFSILGGYERGFGIFVSKVDKASKAEDMGLKRGDQILEVNGQSFEHVSHARALELLRGTTHLCITVRSNLLGFKEMLNTPENSPRPRGRKTEIARLQPDPRARLSSQLEWGDIVGVPLGVGSLPLGVASLLQAPPSSPTSKIPNGNSINCNSSGEKKDDKKGFMTLGHRAKLKKALAKMNIIPKSLNSESHLNSSDDSLYSAHSNSSGGSGSHGGRSASPQRPSGGNSVLYHSHSNPDLTSLAAYYEHDLKLDYPEHVLKVYRSDQTFKYLLVHKETTAREVVMLSLREFGITDPSNNYSLCEVSVGDGGVVKQRRLPDQLQNLAERIGLSSRYYLKNNASTETLVPDELAAELLRESQVHFLQLNSVEVATQLTLEDFSIFRQIEPTEYVDDLFEVKSKYGIPMLSKFAELVNREMFWVVTEVCSEHNLLRRMKIIKQFVKVARQCKECKNFNSMFAILSGLGHGTVSRLRSTWEKLPTKYQKVFDDLQRIMDPSRNMCKYRNLINSEHTQPPIIPFYPVVKKDLTFIHLGNDTFVDNLVNFEKLRMIAKEIRQLMNMCSAPYDLFSMLEIGGAQPSAAMASLNSFATATNAATIKRRKKSTAQPNPKKMFEEAQMVRRVKAYLGNLKVISDEEKLRAMSLDCEATTGSVNSTMLVQPRKRHPSPTLSTTSSTSSTSEGKKSIGSGPRFGADSPKAVRKLLALSDQSKVRPYQPPRHHHSLSPTPSPNAARRRNDTRHGRSHSDSTNPTVLPVDLNAESSSVTTLSNLPLRKSQTSGSVTSSDSSVGSYHHPHMYETDSGHASTGFDSHSSSSLGSTNSPPQQRRALLSHSPPTLRMRPNGPLFPHGMPVLPPIPGPGLLPSHMMPPPPPPPPRESMSGPMFPPTRARRPPDYNIAAQMAARSRQMAHLNRAHSHEGSTTACYYSSDVTDPEDDDDTDAQVSAV